MSSTEKFFKKYENEKKWSGTKITFQWEIFQFFFSWLLKGLNINFSKKLFLVKPIKSIPGPSFTVKILF
jgi:hypothetical protein